MRCFEQTFLPVKAQKYFTESLEGLYRLNATVQKVVEGASNVKIIGADFEDTVDFLIDCTYNHFQFNQQQKHFFEPCLTLTYK